MLADVKNSKCDDYTNCNWNSHQRSGTRTGGLRHNGAGGDYPNYSQNTEKSPGDLVSLKLR